MIPVPRFLAVSQDYRRLLRNISWLSAANLLVKPLWFLFISVLCTRLLGDAQYGVLTASLGLAALVGACADLGTIQVTVRDVSQDRSRATQYLTNMTVLRLIMTAGFLVLAVGLAYLLGYRGTDLAAVFFASVYMLALKATVHARAFFEAFERLPMESKLLVAEKVVVIASGTALLLVVGTAYGVLAGMAAGMTLVAVWHVAWITRRLARMDVRLIDRAFMRGVLAVGAPLGLANIFSVVNHRADAVMIEAMLGPAPAGHYGAAFQLLVGLYVLPNIVATAALFPRLSELWHQRRLHSFDRLLRVGTWGLGLSSVIAAALMTAFAPFIIDVIVPNPAFDPAGPALRVLAWTFPFVCLHSLLTAVLIATDQQRFMAVVLALVMTFNVTVNLVVIPRFGITAAAAVTVVSEVLIVAAFHVRYRTVRRRHAAS